eukprot:CAMPEP_0170569322 /NCGR_PEP_ID=MMETSP0224-20130122/478_1 /TAXON_ID=285029 /ORGANISM="Togula jolla, Strain CCCM 725" /LENGTH=91 /DNA_ID=CAMNT_0010891451 /DNA_START=366 /DNA_END=638 /DNA_ORIENTATION=+
MRPAFPSAATVASMRIMIRLAEDLVAVSYLPELGLRFWGIILIRVPPQRLTSVCPLQVLPGNALGDGKNLVAIQARSACHAKEVPYGLRNN